MVPHVMNEQYRISHDKNNKNCINRCCSGTQIALRNDQKIRNQKSEDAERVAPFRSYILQPSRRWRRYWVLNLNGLSQELQT